MGVRELWIMRDHVVADGVIIPWQMLARGDARLTDGESSRRYRDIIDTVMWDVAYVRGPTWSCPLTPKLGDTGRRCEWSGECELDEDRAHAAWQAWRGR
jgi:hypothetical protein